MHLSLSKFKKANFQQMYFRNLRRPISANAMYFNAEKQRKEYLNSL